MIWWFPFLSTHGTYVDIANENAPFASNMCTSPHEGWKCGICVGFYDKSATSGAILKNPRKECAALTFAHLFQPHETDCIGL